MRVGPLLDFLVGSVRFVRLDPKQYADHPEAERHLAFHRRMARCLIIGAVLGLAAGIAGDVLGLQQPKSKDPHEQAMFFLVPVFSLIVGILGGGAVACLFAPADFLTGPVFEPVLKFVGVKSAIGVRIVSVIVLLMILGVIGIFVWIYFDAKAHGR